MKSARNQVIPSASEEDASTSTITHPDNHHSTSSLKLKKPPIKTFSDALEVKRRSLERGSLVSAVNLNDCYNYLEACNENEIQEVQEAVISQKYLESKLKEKFIKNDVEILQSKASLERVSRGKRLRESLQPPKFLILPDDPFKGYWDLWIMMMLIYTTFITPFRISFYDLDSTQWLVIDTLVDIIFGIDILINFITAYFDSEENIVMSRKAIFCHYLKGWFFIDFISIIPISLILQTGRDYTSLARIARLPRLYRLIKMTKLLRMLKVVKERSVVMKYIGKVLKISPEMEKILYVGFMFITFCHIASCLWYFLAKLEGSDLDTWVFQHGFQDCSIWELYIEGFYWGLTIITTVGFGDISASSSHERLFAMGVMLIGVCCFSYTLGTLSTVLSSLNAKQARFKQLAGILDDVKKDYCIDTLFYMKLRGSLKYLCSKAELDKYDFLNQLPPHLRTELSMIMYENMISYFPFFKNKPKGFITELTSLLKPVKIMKNEYIFKEGEKSDSIYFLSKGKVGFVLTQMNDVPYVKITEGNYFGELDLLLFDEEKGISNRGFTSKALENCELFVLNDTDLFKFCEKYETVFRQFFIRAEIKLTELLKIKENAERTCIYKRKTMSKFNDKRRGRQSIVVNRESRPTIISSSSIFRSKSMQPTNLLNRLNSIVSNPQPSIRKTVTANLMTENNNSPAPINSLFPFSNPQIIGESTFNPEFSPRFSDRKKLESIEGSNLSDDSSSSEEESSSSQNSKVSDENLPNKAKLDQLNHPEMESRTNNMEEVTERIPLPNYSNHNREETKGQEIDISTFSIISSQHNLLDKNEETNIIPCEEEKSSSRKLSRKSSFKNEYSNGNK